MKEIQLTCDILVAGGGLAGVCAAVAAARNGAKTVLCQDRPVLGGNASSEIQMHVVGADCSGKRGRELRVEAREGGIIEEIRLENCVRNPQRSASMFDLILYDLCRKQDNLTLLLNSPVTACSRTALQEKAGMRITSATVENLSSDTRHIIHAPVFIDCTGDGILGKLAGASYRQGREAKAEYDESMACESADTRVLGSSLLFRARKHPVPMPFSPPSWARKVTEDMLVLRPHASTETAVDTGLEYGYWWVEWGGELDPVLDGELIRDELLSIVMGVWDHVKNDGEHGADNWALDWIGFLPGKRESRRFTGQVMVTQDDIMQSRYWDDAIAYGGWPIDVHPPGGVDDTDEEPCTQNWVPNLYGIPLRACISAEIDNLMFAGRNISATHLGFASTRVMATAAVVGQGVGTAAAFAVDDGVLPSEVADNRDVLEKIQQRLLRDDAYLIGVSNTDPGDLARSAVITASSQQPEAPAVNVLSGQTRAMSGSDGIPDELSAGGVHRWMSVPGKAMPQWVMLAWEMQQEIREVALIFDTGMHRVLTLTQSDAYTRIMHWGVPQEESVRDYDVEIRSGGEWRTAVKVRGNYQRRRVHRIQAEGSDTNLCAVADAVRVMVHAVNGLDHARICEVRVY